jgi:hypothetical protein
MPGPGENPAVEQYPDRELLPEEREAGSDDPEAQTRAILEDAKEREQQTRDSAGVERRRAEETVDVSETGGPEGA